MDYKEFRLTLASLTSQCDPIHCELAYTKPECAKDVNRLQQKLHDLEKRIWDLVSAQYPDMSDLDKRQYAYPVRQPIWSFGGKRYQPYGNKPPKR
jgi:hypothetical protein